MCLFQANIPLEIFKITIHHSQKKYIKIGNSFHFLIAQKTQNFSSFLGLNEFKAQSVLDGSKVIIKKSTFKSIFTGLVISNKINAGKQISLFKFGSSVLRFNSMGIFK